MLKPRQRVLIICIGVILLISLAVLLSRQEPTQSYFSPPPSGLTLRAFGNATNYLNLDHQHVWKAFSFSNGTSKTLFYTVTEVEYQTSNGWRSAGSWLSNSLAGTRLMMRRDRAEIPPGTTDVFYATLPTSNVPWRLRVGCFEAGWSQPVDAAVGNLTEKMKGLPPSNTKVWSGPRYELISEQIIP